MMANEQYGPPRHWEMEAGKRNYDFKTDIDRFVANTNQRLLNVVVGAIQSTVNEAQTPRDKGGLMRVKFGFLRASGIATLNVLPSGISHPEKGKTYVWNGEALITVLDKMKFGDVFCFGWVAHYARYREAFDGFLEAAMQNWQKHVDTEVSYYRNKDAKK
jgi:hypothetical protein